MVSHPTSKNVRIRRMYIDLDKHENIDIILSWSNVATATLAFLCWPRGM